MRRTFVAAHIRHQRAAAPGDAVKQATECRGHGDTSSSAWGG
jgi:hypothetical protein